MSGGSVIGAALGMAFALGWEILWALVLGFALSCIVSSCHHQGRDESVAARQLFTTEPEE